jgi:hypothetical protein
MDCVSEPSTTPARPPQVTVACGIVMVGSVFVVLAVWDRIAGLHTIDTREALRPWLDDPLMKKSGVTMSDLLATVKVISMIAGACAAAMAVLGFQTLRRSRSARLVMSVLAVPMFLAGLAADGIFSSGVAAAVATLWFGPARAWFQDGPATEKADRPAAPAAPRSTPPVPAPSQGPSPERPPPNPGWLEPPSSSQPSPGTPYVWAPPPTSAYDAPRPPRSSTRPNALLGACLLVWTFCLMTALLVGGSLAVLATDSATVLDRMHEQDPRLAERGFSDHDLLVIGYVTGSLVIVWSLAAGALAVVVFLRHRWAWYALLVSTIGVVMLTLLATFGFILVLVPLAAAVTTLALLVRPEVKAWLVSR